MKLSNNINILPWYTSVNHQNHKRNFAQYGIFGLLTPADRVLPFQIRVAKEVDIVGGISAVLMDENGLPVPGANITVWKDSLRFVTKDTYALIINDGLVPLTGIHFEGRVYIALNIMYEDSEGIPVEYQLYSEIFTCISDTTRLLKLEYWDNQDFVHMYGVIDYTPPYTNFVYLNTEVGKPEYVFEEEVSKRDGFNFVEKQISEKKFRFQFIAPEYLCDALRIVRMHDNVQVTNVDGVVYNVDTILINPKWQDSGDIAVVEVEFECDTVIKKIAKKFTPNGDYNNDYNNDYYNGRV